MAKYAERDFVRLRAVTEPGEEQVPEEQGVVAKVSQQTWGDSYIVTVPPLDPQDDGLREVTEEDIVEKLGTADTNGIKQAVHDDMARSGRAFMERLHWWSGAAQYVFKGEEATIITTLKEALGGLTLAFLLSQVPERHRLLVANQIAKLIRDGLKHEQKGKKR